MSEFLNTYIFHWVSEKAIYVGGQSLLWDARCSGIYTGFSIGLFWMFLTRRKCNSLPPYPLLLINTSLFIPMFIDLTTLWAGIREPSNDIRYLTGILFGGALSVYLYPTFISLTLKNSKNCTSMDSFTMCCFSLAISIGVFFIKEIDSIFVYWLLYSLSVLGFGSLIAMLLISFGFLSKSFRYNSHGNNSHGSH